MNVMSRTATASIFGCLSLAAVLAHSTSAIAATNVSGTLKSNTTWTLANSPYVLTGTVLVYGGVTLTIEPGVVLKFNGQFRSLNVDGSLVAVGTPTARIVFTSLQDDSIAGDTGGDGATTGIPGQWLDVYVNGSAVFDYVDMRYGGNGSSYGQGQVSGAAGSTIQIDHSTFSFSEWAGVTSTLGTIDIAHSTFTQNRLGVSLYESEGTIRANSAIVANSEVGIFFNYTNGYTGAAPTVTNSEIANNGSVGMRLWVGASISGASAPTGHSNNIFNNNGSLTALQVNALQHIPQSTWSNNYWGPVLDAISCPIAPLTTTQMHLSYSVFLTYCIAPPAGPADSTTFSFSGCPNNGLQKCDADKITNTPYAASPFDNSGY